MKRLTISILMLVVASVYAQTNTQLYLLTGLDSSSHGGIASVTSSVFRIDQQRQLASRVIDLADGKEGIDFIRVDHDRRVVAIGTLPDRVVTLNMDSPTKTMSVSLGGHDGNGPFTVATFFFDKSPFVLAMERKKLNEPSRLLGIDMPAGPEHPSFSQDTEQLARVQRISVMDQIALSPEKPIHGIRQVAGHLTHPQSVGFVRDSTDLHPSSRDIHEEEHNEPCQPRTSPNLYTEEIGGNNLIQMLFQKPFPGRSIDSFRRGLHAVPLENIRDRVPPYGVTQIRQCTLNPSVSPAPVLLGHAKN